MAKAQARFLYTRPSRRPRKVELRAFPFRIGRDRSCELRLDDPLASPIHAVVDRKDGVYHLCNRSVNGTRLAGQPVRGVRTLLPGQRIEIGEGVALEFELRDAATRPRPRRSRLGWLDRRRALWLGLGAYAVALVAGAAALAALDLSPAAGRATPEGVRRAAEQTRAHLIDRGTDEDRARALADRADALLFRAWRHESEGRRPDALDAYREVVRLVPSLRAPTTQLAVRQIRRLEEVRP